MPIKFACPSCNSTLVVKDEMAGKKAKCKCGAVIQVPSAKSAAASQQSRAPQSRAKQKSGSAKAKAPAQNVSPGLGDALGELTESDYASKSPYEKVYHGGGGQGNDAAALRRFESDEDRQKKATKGKLTAPLMIFAVLFILQGIGWVALTAMVFAAPDAIASAAEKLPMFYLPVAALAAICIAMTVVTLGGGVGIFLKQKWGWTLAATGCVYNLCNAGVGMVLVIMAGFEQLQFFGALIPLFISLAIAAYMFNGNTQEVFRIKTAVPAAIAVVLGLALGGGLNAAGASSKPAPQAPAAADEGAGYEGGEY